MRIRMAFFIHPDLTEINLALYDTALPKVRASSNRPFLEYRAEVASLIWEFRLALV